MDNFHLTKWGETPGPSSAASKLDTGDSSSMSNTGDVRSTDYHGSVAFSSNLFQKLSNPLSSLLKEVPTVDGDNAHMLCEFLLKVIRIAKIGHLKEPFIYELLYPYCRGALLECLSQALTNREDFDSFHARVLRRFIPRRRLMQLRHETYERIQKEGETLGSYVGAIRDAASVLRINESEAEIVAHIVEGLHLNQRARLLFQALPSSFEQLEQLAVVDRNFSFVDSSSTSGAGSTTANTVQPQYDSRPTQHRPGAVNNAPLPGKELVCFNCGKSGHMRRQCRFRHTQLRRNHLTIAKTQL